MTVSRILNNHSRDIAFIVGNGINRFGEESDTNSWDILLLKLWNKYAKIFKSEVPAGISLTEFFDVIDIIANSSGVKIDLQKEFCTDLSSWTPKSQHCTFLDWAKQNRTPILTTNFDEVLSKAGECKAFRENGKFTHYYPWDTYFSNNPVNDINSEFGIWHINGMSKYHKSIRLGLTHYMGSVQRARSWIYEKGPAGLFESKNINTWKGAKTWLQLIIKKDIFIFGIGLNENEIFLRWLLIERAKLYKKFPDLSRRGWYVCKERTESQGKMLFLRNLGFDIINVDTYEDIYINPWV